MAAEDTPVEDFDLPADPRETFDIPLDGKPRIEEVAFDENDPNLVFALMGSEEGKESLRKVSDRVFRDFEGAWKASENYRTQMASDLRYFSGDLEPKEYPYKDAANMHVPIMLENMTRLSLRTEGEIFGDWSQWFQFTPYSEDDKFSTDVCTKHSEWQFRERYLDFPRQMSRAILMYYVNGDVTCHSYWDPERQRAVHEMLTPDDFVTPYTHITVEPDYSDLPFYAKVFRRYRHQMEAMKETWFDVDKVLEKGHPSWDDEPDAPIREARAEMEQIETPSDSEESAPYKLIWYEGWLKLYGQDRQRWCQVILDHQTRCILSLAIHEKVDPLDKQRYERELGEMQMYKEAQAVRGAAIQNLASMSEKAAMLPPDPMLAQQAALELQQAQAMVPPEPMEPEWVKSPEDFELGPELPRKVPVYNFTHAVCIEPLTGNLGLSFGRIQANFNRAANTALNQATDAATLANTKAFLTADTVELDKPIEVRPGAFIKVPGVMPGQLEGSIIPLQFGEPSPALFQAVDRNYQYGQSSVQAPGVLSGESGKSGETYRGIAARIEQATAQLSVAARKFAWLFVRQIVRKNAELNAIYMPDQEMFTVLDKEVGRYVTYTAKREDYVRSYQIAMKSDLRFAPTAQRISEADELVAMPANVPGLQPNLAFQYAALVKALKERGMCELIPLLGMAPTPPQAYGLPSPELLMMQQGMMGGAPPGAPPGSGPPPGPGGGGGEGIPGPQPGDGS